MQSSYYFKTQALAASSLVFIAACDSGQAPLSQNRAVNPQSRISVPLEVGTRYKWYRDSAYHSTVTKQLNQYQENFRPVLARADPDLANDFAMRWIKEYFEAMTEQGKQQKIAQAQNSCRKLSLPH